MRPILSLLIILILSCSLVATDAEAKRFGGGRSFGYQRSSTSYARPQATQAARPANPAAPQSTASKWLGPLAGLAAGGLLASLFMGHGLGSGIMSWLLIAGVGLVIFLLIRSWKRSSALPVTPSPFSNQSYPFTSNNQEIPQHESHAAPTYSADFNQDEFLREAKVQFMRLQASYDSKNLTDLREFTTPEVFAEIQLQLQERGEQENITEVVSLNAEVLDVSEELQTLVVSAHFSGMIREKRDEAPIHFDEIWHFKKDAGMSWRVAGIQQN